MFLTDCIGIIRCDMTAQAIISAASKLSTFPVPVVVRLQGTNSEEAQNMVCRSKTILRHKWIITVTDCQIGAQSFRRIRLWKIC